MHADDVANNLVGINHAGPPGESGHANTTFVEVAFTAAEGAVAVEEEGAVSVGRLGAVVAGENDEGVLGEPVFLQRGHDLANDPV